MATPAISGACCSIKGSNADPPVELLKPASASAMIRVTPTIIEAVASK